MTSATVTCNIFGMSDVKQRVKEYRQHLRDMGYRPVQLWVPDTRTDQFAKTAERDALAVARADQIGDDQAFVEAISAGWDD